VFGGILKPSRLGMVVELYLKQDKDIACLFFLSKNLLNGQQIPRNVPDLPVPGLIFLLGFSDLKQASAFNKGYNEIFEKRPLLPNLCVRLKF
jgi:hypothetical protein